MLQKKPTPHWKTLRKRGGKSISSARHEEFPRSPKIRLLHVAPSQDVSLPHQDLQRSLSLNQGSTDTSTEVFLLPFTLPCPELHQLRTGDRAGSKDVSCQGLTLTNAGCVGERCSGMKNISIKHVVLSRHGILIIQPASHACAHTVPFPVKVLALLLFLAWQSSCYDIKRSRKKQEAKININQYLIFM